MIALKSGGRGQEIAEIEEIQRGHGLQNAHLIDQHLLDLHDAVEARDGNADILFIDIIIAKHRHHRIQFMEDLLEPQFVSLMDDDEEHLIMGRRAQFGAPGRLAGEDLFQLEIVAVFDGRMLFAHVALRVDGWMG